MPSQVVGPLVAFDGELCESVEMREAYEHLRKGENHAQGERVNRHEGAERPRAQLLGGWGLDCLIITRPDRQGTFPFRATSRGSCSEVLGGKLHFTD